MPKVKNFFFIILSLVFFQITTYVNPVYAVDACTSNTIKIGYTTNPPDPILESVPSITVHLTGVATAGYRLAIASGTPGHQNLSVARPASGGQVDIPLVEDNGNKIFHSGLNSFDLQNADFGKNNWGTYCNGINIQVGFATNSCKLSIPNPIKTNQSVPFSVSNAPSGGYTVCVELQSKGNITVDGNGNSQPFVLQPLGTPPRSVNFELIQKSSQNCVSGPGQAQVLMCSTTLTVESDNGKSATISCAASVSGTTANITCANLPPGGSYMNTVLFSEGSQAAQLSTNADSNGTASYIISGLSVDNYTYQITDSIPSVVFSGKFSVGSPGSNTGALSAPTDPCAAGAPAGKCTNATYSCYNNALGICINTDDPSKFMQSLLTIATGIAGGVALLLMGFGAIGMITSQGNAEALKAAQGRFTSAVIGLLFIIFAVFLLKFISVNILGIPGFG